MNAPPADAADAGAAAADGALFVPAAGGVVPTDRARGPWSPEALHGGPVAALVVRSAERHDGSEDDGLQLARITLELLRPVPMAPLAVMCTLVKPGRKVQLLDVVIEAGGVEVAKARALRLRVAGDQSVFQPSVPEDDPPPPPARCSPRPPMFDRYPAFHNQGVEMRFASGIGDVPGPATVWFRLLGPVVAGEEPTPWQRAAAAADFGNGVSNELDFSTTSFVNADLTVSIHRPPTGSWVCLEARTRFGSPGIGAAESAMWDVEGRIGRAVQHLVVEARR
ncbi:MAG: thioesterase family protein [Acidimicrobiales bacterium]